MANRLYLQPAGGGGSVDFDNLTPEQQASLCAAIANCDITSMVDFTALSPQQTTNLAEALRGEEATDAFGAPIGYYLPL